MSEQEKKRQRIYDLLKALTKPKFLCLRYTEAKKNIFFFLQKKRFLKKWGVADWTKNEEGFLTTFALAIKK